MTKDNLELLGYMKDDLFELQRLMSYYRCAIMEIETKFKVLDEEYSLQHDRNPINSIKSRLKKFPSIIEMDDKNKDMINLIRNLTLNDGERYDHDKLMEDNYVDNWKNYFKNQE